MLAHAAPVAVVAQPDPARLPFADAEFDFVTAVCVFHHVEPAGRPALLAEMTRVLRPHGLMMIVEHNPLNPVTRLIVSRTPVDQDARLLSAGAVRRLFAQARIESIASEALPPDAGISLRARRRARADAVARPAAAGQYAVLGKGPRT